jgi:gas vesicle protein
MSNHVLSNLSSSALLDMLGLQSKQSTRNRVMTYFGFAFAGAIIGATAALMLAPKSGRQLRQDIRGGAKELGEKVSHGASAIADTAKRQVNEVGNHISDVAASNT